MIYVLVTLWLIVRLQADTTALQNILLEHIIRSHIMTHFDTHNIFLDTKHGFRKHRSTETQLKGTIHDFAQTIDEGGQMDCILLDFSKAFDKVPHRRLLHK